MRKSKLLLGFLMASAFSLPVHAKLYKWVDNQGVTHYGEIVPPEYADKEKQTLKKSGLIEKKVEQPDENALKAKSEASAKLKAEREADMLQKRRNATLLNTYSNEHEIDLALERSLVLVNARIESNQMLLKSAQSSLDDLNKESEARTKSGKKIPQSLTNDINQTQARVDKYKADLAKSMKELEDVKARFDGEKELYRKIKSGKN